MSYSLIICEKDGILKESFFLFWRLVLETQPGQSIRMWDLLSWHILQLIVESDQRNSSYGFSSCCFFRYLSVWRKEVLQGFVICL